MSSTTSSPTPSASSESEGTSAFVLYHYSPNQGAAIAFVAFFGLCTVAHTYKLIKHRTWYFIPFLIGLLFETAGYIGRIISSNQTPDWTTGPYVLQSLTLLLGPTLLAASIYMTLGRLIRLLNAESYSLIRTKWLTKVFVLGDMLSFFTQSGGGGMLATAKSKSSTDLGQNVILGGLVIQIIFFGMFMVVTFVFHRRIVGRPTPASRSARVPWLRFLYVLYAASVLIMVRSIFRVAEYAGGYSGPLQSSEVYLYIFDATLMFIVAFIFVVWHPSAILKDENGMNVALSDMETPLQDYSFNTKA